MSEQNKWHPDNGRAQEHLKRYSEEDLKQFLEAEVTEQDVKDELVRRLGERGLTFSYLISEEQVEVFIKPETTS